ncbi:MAG: GNAT family N-acetyltransferase [Gammaproteobacteria bacterium]
MIRLRDYEEHDCGRLVYLADNKNVSRYLIDTFPYPYTWEYAIWWVRVGCKSGGSLNQVIEYRGEFAGGIGLTPQHGWKRHTAEIGYWLGEPYWGKGIASEALNLFCGFVFSEMQFRKLFAQVMASNASSIRVLEKCGFEQEGILKSEVIKDGQYFDMHHFGKYRI